MLRDQGRGYLTLHAATITSASRFMHSHAIARFTYDLHNEMVSLLFHLGKWGWGGCAFGGLSFSHTPRTHARTHARARARTHTHTHTHTHTNILCLNLLVHCQANEVFVFHLSPASVLASETLLPHHLGIHHIVGKLRSEGDPAMHFGGVQ